MQQIVRRNVILVQFLFRPRWGSFVWQFKPQHDSPSPMPTVCRAVVSPRLKDLLRACFKKKWRTPLAGSHISCVKICLYCNRAASKDNFHLKDRCFVQAAPYCSTPSTHTIATMAIFHATVPPRTVAHVRSRAGHHKSWPHLRCEDGVVPAPCAI